MLFTSYTNQQNDSPLSIHYFITFFYLLIKCQQLSLPTNPLACLFLLIYDSLHPYRLFPNPSLHFLCLTFITRLHSYFSFIYYVSLLQPLRVCSFVSMIMPYINHTFIIKSYLVLYSSHLQRQMSSQLQHNWIDMPVLIEVEAATDISFFWCVTDLDVLALSFHPWNKKF